MAIPGNGGGGKGARSGGGGGGGASGPSPSLLPQAAAFRAAKGGSPALRKALADETRAYRAKHQYVGPDERRTPPPATKRRGPAIVHAFHTSVAARNAKPRAVIAYHLRNNTKVPGSS